MRVCAAKWEQPEGLRRMPLVPDYLDGGHDLAQLPRFQRLRAAAAGALALTTDSKLPNQRRCGTTTLQPTMPQPTAAMTLSPIRRSA